MSIQSASIKYPGPKIEVKGTSDLCIFGFTGLVMYLLKGFVTQIFEIYYGKTKLTNNTIQFILDKATIYKNKVLITNLITFLNNRLETLNLGLPFIIKTWSKKERIYIEICFSLQTQEERDLLLGLLHLKGYTSTLQDLKCWFLYNFGFTTPIYYIYE